MDQNENQNQEKTPEMPNAPDGMLNKMPEQEKNVESGTDAGHETEKVEEKLQDTSQSGNYEARHIKILAGATVVLLTGVTLTT